MCQEHLESDTYDGKYKFIHVRDGTPLEQLHGQHGFIAEVDLPSDEYDSKEWDHHEFSDDGTVIPGLRHTLQAKRSGLV